MRLKFLLFILSIFLFHKTNFGQILTSSNLPIISIQTGGATIEDEPKISAQMRVLAVGTSGKSIVADSLLAEMNPIGIEIRGSSSQQAYPKVGYAIETRDDTGAEKNVEILGMPKGNDWVLVGPYNDKTLMRDAFSYLIAAESMTYTPRVRYVELLIDNEYTGIYLFLEKIKRGKNRVDIAKLMPTDNAGDQLTGGYILKLDKPTGATLSGFESKYASIPGYWTYSYFQYHYPSPESISLAQQNYIQTYIQEFEDKMQSLNYKDSINGYRQFVDIDSWVNFFLINEITKNLDAYRLSTFLYKNRDSVNNKLFLGPIWDFNISFGIGDYCNGQPWTGWSVDFNEVCPADSWVIPFWWKKLMADPYFKQKIRARWQELRADKWTNQQLFCKIDSLQTLLTASQSRNFERWPVIGTYVWPNAFVGNSWNAEIAYMRDWLTNRLVWMDGQIEDFLLDSVEVNTPILRVSPQPNPATGRTFFEYSTPSGVVVGFKLYDATGRFLRHWPQIPSGKSAVFELPLPADSGFYFWQILIDNKPVSEGKILVTP